MGLFPEIGRAWLTIDSDIYVIRIECYINKGYNICCILVDLDVREF